MKVETILIPTDFSKLSEEAIETGVTLARAFSARIVLLHVMNRPEDREKLSASYDDFYAYTRDQMSGLLEEACEKIEKKGVPSSLELVIGLPHEEIVRVALREKADLIVMGTHGRKGFDRLRMGSQTEQVVRSAHCPVVTLKGSAKEADDQIQVELKRAPSPVKTS